MVKRGKDKERGEQMDEGRGRGRKREMEGKREKEGDEKRGWERPREREREGEIEKERKRERRKDQYDVTFRLYEALRTSYTHTRPASSLGSFYDLFISLHLPV